MEAASTFFADPTLRTVLVAAVAMGATGGTLGAFTLLRRQSLLGDVLSHAALPGVALAFLLTGSRSLGPLLAGAAVTGIAAAWTVAWIVRHGRLKTDAALGVTLGTWFAAGVVLLSAVQGRRGAGQAGLETFLFGQAAAVLRSDLWTIVTLAVLVMVAIVVPWNRWKIVTFDPAFAASLRVPVRRWDLAMTTLVAVAVVVCLQMMGVVLTAAMLVAPAVAARQWTDRLGPMVATSALLGVTGAVVGAVTSARVPGISTGPTIVLASTAITVLSLAFAPRRGIVTVRLRRWIDRSRS